MRIFWTLNGYYERLLVSGSGSSQTSLKILMSNIQKISTHQKCYHLGRIHENFGLEFIPKKTFIHLMHQALGHNPQIADNILLPSISTVENTLVDFSPTKYKFVTQGLSTNFHLELEWDDPQIPSIGSEKLEGYYKFNLSEIDLEVNDDSVFGELAHMKQIAEQKISNFINQIPLEVLHAAMLSVSSEEFSLSPATNITCWLEPRDLPSHLQLALSILKEQYLATEIEDLNDGVQALVSTYRTNYESVTYTNCDIPKLQVVENSGGEIDILISKGLYRDKLTQLIDEAEKYLLICSYRLEDIEIVTKIAEKSTQIPVWILTDFSDEVQDRVDLNMAGQLRDKSDYINSDIKKKECLQMLLQAGVGFRSGSFHVKTYISEKSAYLGSCNLTGGSLSRNGEAGLFWTGDSYHQELIDYFRHLWGCKANAKANPSPTGLKLEGILPQYKSNFHSLRFLNSHTFNQDLHRELQEFTKNPLEEIRIYTRSFNPTYQQLSLLRHLKHRIYYGSSNQTSLKAQLIPNLHAKIILLGRQVAYIGTQDFNFGRGSLLDLTYKTKNCDEIDEIYQNLRNLH